MRRVLLSIAFILLLFLIPSCGIPDIFVPSSSSVSTRTIQNSVNIKLDNSISGLENNPELFLFYIVECDDSEIIDTNFKTLISDFSNEYCTETSGLPIGNTNYSKKYNFSGQNDDQIENTYFFSQFSFLPSFTIDYSLLRNDEWNFDFNFENGKLKLTFYDNERGSTIRNVIKETVLSRYNGKDFNESCIGDECPESLRSESGTKSLVIKIYAIASFDFISFTNHFNTKPSYTNPIYKFTVDLN